LLAGAVADATTLTTALGVPTLCYLYVAWFGWFARRPAAEVQDAPILI